MCTVPRTVRPASDALRAELTYGGSHTSDLSPLNHYNDLADQQRTTRRSALMHRRMYIETRDKYSRYANFCWMHILVAISFNVRILWL